MAISQLDLVLLGGRGITARVGDLEGALRSAGNIFQNGAGAPSMLARPNLLLNSSFEFYNRGAEMPQNWGNVGFVHAVLRATSADADGNVTLELPPSCGVSQTVASGNSLPAAAFVLSVVARTIQNGVTVGLTVTHTPGVTYGPIYRMDSSGNITQHAEVPSDNNWYRFFVQGQLVGGAPLTAIVTNTTGGPYRVFIDCVKFEMEAGATSNILPTAYESSDWGSSTIIRDLTAENITAGKLTVGGALSTNPRISVLDSDNVEIVTLGDPTGGFYGVEIKGAAGERISGAGSLEVLGGGSIKVKGGGDITVDGGDILVTDGSVAVSGTGGIDVSGGGGISVGNGGDIVVSGGGNIELGTSGSLKVSDTGFIRAGTDNAQRVDINNGGLFGYGPTGVEQVHIDSGDGNLKIVGPGGIQVTGLGGITVDSEAGITVSNGGGILLDDNGILTLTGTGKIQAGPDGGYHAELGAGGLALFDSLGDESILLSSITGKVHVFGDPLEMEDGGKLTIVSGIVWGDNTGFWVIDTNGNAAFGVSGVDGKAWGNLPGAQPLDQGDILLGNTLNYVWWDASANELRVSGEVTAGSGHVVLGTNGLEMNSDGSAYLSWVNGSQVIGYVAGNHQDVQSDTVSIVAGNARTVNGNVTLNARGISNLQDVWVQVVAQQLNTVTPGGYVSISGQSSFLGVSIGSGTQPRAMLDVVGPAYFSQGLTVGYTVPTAAAAGNVLAAGNFYPGGAADCYFGRWGTSTPFISGNVVVGSSLYPGNQGSYYIGYTASPLGLFTNGNFTVGANVFPSNQGSYYWAVSGATMLTNGHLRTQANLYVGTSQTARYFHDDGTYTRYQGSLVVDGDLYVNGYWLSARIPQALTTTSDVMFQTLLVANCNNTAGGSMFGNILTDYLPTSGGWTYNTNLIVQGNDYASIGFHDAGSRVDFIVGGGGILRLGYNGGWGAAVIAIPGVTKMGGNCYIGNTAGNPTYQITLSTDSAGKPNGGSWTNSSSDARTKLILGDYEYGLDAVRKLHLVRYEYNGLGGSVEGLRGTGFIAQEAREVIPDMVGTRRAKLHEDDAEEQDILTVNNDPAIYAAIRSIQELADLVDALRAEVAELRAKKA